MELADRRIGNTAKSSFHAHQPNRPRDTRIANGVSIGAMAYARLRGCCSCSAVPTVQTNASRQLLLQVLHPIVHAALQDTSGEFRQGIKDRLSGSLPNDPGATSIGEIFSRSALM